MFVSSLIEELCSKETKNKACCTLTFLGQCKFLSVYYNLGHIDYTYLN